MRELARLQLSTGIPWKYLDRHTSMPMMSSQGWTTPLESLLRIQAALGMIQATLPPLKSIFVSFRTLFKVADALIKLRSRSELYTYLEHEVAQT